MSKDSTKPKKSTTDEASVVREKEKAKTIRTLIIVGLIIFVLSSPLWLCGGCSIITALLPDRSSSDSTIEDYDNGDEATETDDQSDETGQEVVQISYSELVERVKENEARAKDDFEGKLIEVSGYVKTVDDRLVDSGYNVTLTETADSLEWSGITAVFNEDMKDLVLAMNAGQNITVRGKFSSITFGSVILVDCVVVE